MTTTLPTIAKRRLGLSSLWVSPVSLGCWPLAGITSGAIPEATALAVIETAIASGINHLDTAYAYGRHGESDRLVARAIGPRRNDLVLATKVGVYWTEDGQLRRTGDPRLLRRHFEESLVRLGLDQIDLLYCHAPADDAPLAETAGLFRRLLDEGKTQAVGVSNFSVEQMETFAAECPFAAAQVQYNWLERDIESDILPWCRAHEVSVVAYEPLAKGLLTGKFTRDHVFAEGDWRRDSSLFTGEAWTKNLDRVACLGPAARQLGCSVAEWAVGWVISQPGVATALCGAKRPEQIRQTAGAMFLAETSQAFEKSSQ